MQRISPNASMQSRYDTPASIRNPRATQHSVGVGDPLESVAIPSSIARRCPNAAFKAQNSSDAIRKSNLKAPSNASSRLECMHSRAHAPAVCTRGGVAQAALAARGKTEATKVAAKKAERRVATVCPRRLIILDRRLSRPTARPRLSSRAEPRGGMVGGVGDGTRGKQVVPGRVEGDRHTDWREREITATRLVGSRKHCDAEIIRGTKTMRLGGRVERDNSGRRNPSTY